jgi:hypothetical protein
MAKTARQTPGTTLAALLVLGCTLPHMKHATVDAFLPEIKRHRTGHGIATTDKAAIDKAFDDLLRQVPRGRLNATEVTITVSAVQGS